MADKKAPLKEVPEKIVDPSKQITYTRGRFLGKGGFARCYELTDTRNGVLSAGKIVSKTLLQKPYQKEKMAQEISIHRKLQHAHIVRLDGFFEDNDNVYILLELCPRRSLMELHKRRKAVTEPEARYFTHQIALGIGYLHDRKVIHRDLKLGNIFLNEEMQVKLGDFGLATQVDHPGERKKTLCGTPNYIAPEVLNKSGHSFEVDIWAIGCILYTLMVGKPPFETQTLKDTYQRIRENQYKIPSHIDRTPCSDLIQRLLAADPQRRPLVADLLKHEFFRGFTPKRLPTSCLTMAPKFDKHDARMSLGGYGSPSRGVLSPRQIARQDIQNRPAGANPAAAAACSVSGADRPPRADFEKHIHDLYDQLTNLFASSTMYERELQNEDITEAPEAMPVFWISKWVDYSDKYGIGYQLCDNSVGVLFNDSTKLVLDSAGRQLMYTDKEGGEEYYLLNQHNEVLTKKDDDILNVKNVNVYAGEMLTKVVAAGRMIQVELSQSMGKKVTLLKYFRAYMNEHLIKAGASFAPKEGDELARLPCLRYWFRTRSAIVLHLTNGTLQINFFNDHTKLIVCPLIQAVTYIDQNKTFRVFKFSLLKEHGCGKEIYSRLKYALQMSERLMSQAGISRPGGSTRSTRSASAPKPVAAAAGGGAAHWRP